jgi:hypothetical protein
MKTAVRFFAALFIAASFSVVSTGCTAGSLTGPQESETIEQTAEKPTPGAETNGDETKTTDPGGNDHNISSD